MKENMFYSSLREALESGEEIDITLCVDEVFWEVYGATVVKLNTSAVKIKYPLALIEEEFESLDDISGAGELTIRTRILALRNVIMVDFISSRLISDKTEVSE
jgi:hypothetical protein